MGSRRDPEFVWVHEDTTLHIFMEEHGVLCGSFVWKFSDDPIGRDHLLCRGCCDRYTALYGDDRDLRTQAQGYAEYLASPHWQHMRAVAHEHYGGSCCLCGSTEGVDVHHRTYERKGKERLADVTLLCRDCHRKHHGQAA